MFLNSLLVRYYRWRIKKLMDKYQKKINKLVKKVK
jgi:hypothetical protein